MTSNHQIELTETISAPIDQVFQAWLEPEHMKQWMSPSDEYTIPVAQSDPQVGGKYKIVMKHPKHGEHTAVGEYKQIQKPNKLVYTWKWLDDGMGELETLVAITLKQVDGKTELKLLHQNFVDDPDAQRHLEGWTGCLSRLQAHLAQ